MTLYHGNQRYVSAIVLSLVIAFGSLPMMGCGEKQLSQAAEAAKDIGGGTRDVIKAVAEAYTQGLITIQQKDKFADLLSAIAKGGKKGVDVIETLQRAGVDKLSGADSKKLTLIFDDEVISPFLELLQELGKLSESSSVAIRAALSSVRTAIVILSSRIGRNDVIEQIKAREVWNA